MLLRGLNTLNTVFNSINTRTLWISPYFWPDPRSNQGRSYPPPSLCSARPRCGRLCMTIPGHATRRELALLAISMRPIRAAENQFGE